MKKQIIFSFLMLLILISISSSAWCANIVRPWRSTTAIVKAGDSFETWFNADNGQTVNSVQLRGLYNTVNTTITIENGNWVYDPLSGNTYNTKINVSVPSDAPADRYDLILKTSAGDVVSYGGVKVVTNFKEDYYIMHMSDGHIYQSGYDPVILLARKSAMIDIANIMDCQIIIETGDNMYNVRNHPEREVNYFLGIENEGIKGMAKATAATFLVPGDHDAYTANDWPQASVQVNSDFFNDYWGLQNSCFKYGGGRFMMLNNAWETSTTSGKDHQYQCDDAISWLQNAGSGGNFFLTAGHCYDKMHEFIDAYEKLDLVLAGDKHHIRTDNPYEFDPGSAKLAYVAGSIRDHFEFNLFSVNDNAGTYTAVPGVNGVANVLKSGNQDTRSTWIPNLRLTYSNNNNGSFIENTATIVNDFDFPINGARVRFVMPKGFNYEFTNATLLQQFEGDLFQIVDVTTDLSANSTVSIYTRADDLCPNDPDKTEPGLCGCGVPEGTCESFPLVVNNGNGDGIYQPYELVTITADPPSEGMEFYAWVVNSGTPTIADTTAITTTLTLTYNPASITATYKEIPKINESVFISQELPTLTPGETISVSIIMKNAGTTSWTKNGGYKLGFPGSVDSAVWGLSRVELDVDEEINPNEEKTFSFDIRVPVDNGQYIFQWQMMEEGIEWFGSKTDIEILRIGGEGIYLDDCDQLTDWKSTASLILNGVDKQQGANCIEFTGSGTDEYKKVFSTPYFSGGSVNSTVLQFWYYTSDPSKMGTNQVELGSGGKNDADEYNWSLSGLSAGWNFIRLKISDATALGSPDLNKVNWFRIYNKKTASITTRLDAIEIIDPTAGERYSLTVNNGDGDGMYYAGSEISIHANSAPVNQIFDKWIVSSGSPIIWNESALSTYLTMPANDAIIAATYKPESHVSIDKNDAEKNIAIYPNPLIGNYLSMDLNGFTGSKIIDIEITSLMGQSVIIRSSENQKKIIIDTEGLLEAGIYIVTLRSENSLYNTKLLIK
ncbi:MAG: T9SS type A sorting domain-containing protein [Bacteroidales bacterium]|nr:T9SS type A sorting domain-containing protein [Bacteroidales bacterium]MCF8391391.1 T9SS type A sorting domain-containing protein [Bacteroidales bacterium]